MQLMFPCKKQTVATLKGAISVVKSPDNRLYAVLKPNSIVILDAFDPSYSEIETFETQPGSANHWILWPINNKLAYGTFSGTINILSFEGFHLSADVEKSLSCVITNAFLTKNGNFGFSLIGPRIIQMNTKGEIVSSFALDPALGILTAVLPIDEQRICVKSYTTWYIYNTVAKSTAKVDIAGLESITGDLICVTSNGSVLQYNDETKESETLIESGIARVHQFSRGLIGITKSGDAFVYDSMLKQMYRRELDLSNVISSFVDEFGRKLVVLNSEGEVICVSCFIIAAPYLLTDSSLTEIDGMRVTAEIPDLVSSKRVKAIPLDLFPLQNVVPNGDSCVCIIGRAGVVILSKYSVFYEPDICPLFTVWINDMLCVITRDGIMSIFNDELLKIGDFKLSQIPAFVSACGMRMVMSIGARYSVFNFGDRQDTEAVVKIGHLEIGVTSFEVPFNLKKIFILRDNTLYTQADDGTVYSVENNQPVFYTPQEAWANDVSLFFFKDGGVTVISDGKTARFQNIRSVYSWNTCIYNMNDDLSITTINFAARLVPLGSPEQNELAKSMMTMIGQSSWEEEFRSVLTEEMPAEELCTALKQIDASLVPQFLNLMSDSIIERLSHVGFDFTPFFADVKHSIQSRILNRIQPDLFDNLIDTHNRIIASKEDRFKYFVANKMLDRYAFVRATKFTRVANINFTALLEEKDIGGVSMVECLKAIRSDIAAWSFEEDAEIVNLLGRSFQFVELSNWALACFLVLGSEERVGALLNNQPMALMMAMQLTREQPDDENSVFLKNLELGF